MASAVPVVATDVGAFSELVVDGVTGTIVAPGNADAMATAVEPLIADDVRRQSFADAALAHVRENFPLQKEAATLVGIYRNLSGGV
jgi:mannosyltransferase